VGLSATSVRAAHGMCVRFGLFNYLTIQLFKLNREAVKFFVNGIILWFTQLFEGSAFEGFMFLKAFGFYFL
jgi:hypothetical protein